MKRNRQQQHQQQRVGIRMGLGGRVHNSPLDQKRDGRSRHASLEVVFKVQDWRACKTGGRARLEGVQDWRACAFQQAKHASKQACSQTLLSMQASMLPNL